MVLRQQQGSDFSSRSEASLIELPSSGSQQTVNSRLDCFLFLLECRFVYSSPIFEPFSRSLPSLTDVLLLLLLLSPSLSLVHTGLSQQASPIRRSRQTPSRIRSPTPQSLPPRERNLLHVFDPLEFLSFSRCVFLLRLLYLCFLLTIPFSFHQSWASVVSFFSPWALSLSLPLTF